jgi:hypothetical protein
MWSDDFNDGNYNGWTVTNGTFSAADHTLRSIGAGGAIIHSSSVTTGTWSFDILGVNTTAIGIMSNYPIPTSALNTLGITKIGIVLALDVAVQGSGTRVTEYDFPSGTRFSGWQHIDITRSSDGRTCVYHNGTLVIDRVVTQITASEYLWVLFGSSQNVLDTEGAIDNIVVSNTIDIQPPAPPFYMQTWFWATIVAVAVVVVVIVVLLMRRK